MIFPVLSNFRQALLTDKKKGTKYVIIDEELSDKIYSSIKQDPSIYHNDIQNVFANYVEEKKLSYEDGDIVLVANDDFQSKFYFLVSKPFYSLIYALVINDDIVIDRTLTGADYNYLKTLNRYKDSDTFLVLDLYQLRNIKSYAKNQLVKPESAEIFEDLTINGYELEQLASLLNKNPNTSKVEETTEEIMESIKKNYTFIKSISPIEIGKYNDGSDIIIQGINGIYATPGYDLVFSAEIESKSKYGNVLIFFSRNKNYVLQIAKSTSDKNIFNSHYAISKVSKIEYDQFKKMFENYTKEISEKEESDKKQDSYQEAVKVVEAKEQIIENTPTNSVEQIVAPVSNPVDKSNDDFWKEAEALLDDEITKEEEQKVSRKKNESEKAKKEKIEKNKEKLSTPKEISEEEFVVASKETIYEPETLVDLKVPNISIDDITKSIRTKEDKFKTQAKVGENDYPADWNYIYTIKETSKMYNPTVLIDGEKGMTIEEWNAYFLSHPELGHLIEETIGEFGGIIYSEKELMDMGLLLYNPETKKLQYKYEYLSGNAYTLLENFESVFQDVVNLYGEEFFDTQKQTTLNAMPIAKNYESTDIEKQPYIHPLDEVVIDFSISSAGEITFPININSKLVNAIKRVHGKDLAKAEEELSGIQTISIVNFFREWLHSQSGKLGNYGLKDIFLVDDSYFSSLSYAGYLNYLREKGYTPGINPDTGEKYTIEQEVTESDFFEVKESIKSFVNNMFQEFIREVLSTEDRNNLLYAWNKKYNGFVKIDPYKFPVFIKHAKYIKDRTKKIEFKLSDTQVEGIKFATINNSSIIAHEVGYGKAEWIENKIFTPTGTKKMGELQIGDYVIGSNGQPTMVIGTFPQGEKEMYKVSFSDKTNVIVCSEHLWQVQSMRQRSQEKYKNNHFVKTTKEIKELGLTYERTPGHIQNKWAIPMTKPVEFQNQNVFIDPYLLGVLIGDGCLSQKSISFSTADSEILESISHSLPNGVNVRKKKYSDIDYGLSTEDKNNPLTTYLKHYELHGTKSNTKFIPDEYKYNSIDVRLSLLQGLMDTDGSASKHQLEYTTISKQLAQDFVFLVQSLGGTARITNRKTKYTYKGELKEGQESYRIDVRVPGYIQPFRLKRKIEKYVPKTKYQPTRFITNIEYAGKLEAKCIKVEAQDSLYLTENFIVTHNTLTSIGFMSHMFETNQANNIMVLVPKALYANKKWKEEISGNIDTARNRTILGAIPQYNLIEMNNFSTTFVFNDGEEGGPKEYTDDEIRTIRSFAQKITEIGGTIRGRKIKTPPTAKGLLPTNLNYSRSVNYWTKVIDELRNTDLNLYTRSAGRNGELFEQLLSILNSKTATKSQSDIIDIADNLMVAKYIKTEFEKDYPGAIFDRNNPTREFNWFVESETSSVKYKRDKEGKIVKDTDGKKIELAPIKVSEAYIIMQLEEIHYWLNTTLQKMSDFAIYEYGKWNFPVGKKNIILATRDSLENLGFSSNSREDMINVIKEITEYKFEQTTDIEKEIIYAYTDNQGVKQSFTRKPQNILSRQLEDLITKIENYMTEEGDYGKFFLNNLGIDGFILDEAHLAKKIFTNVKTDKRMEFELPTGKYLSMSVSSHDIKGGAAPPRALRVFGVSQYIRSLGDKKPLMLLTATPFSNQPTEIFSMLSIVGIKQLRQQGISNIKNFFDLFLKESLKYDFDHKGNFIKRITVEDFRNKELLANVIWSVIDIKREASIKDSEDKKNKKGAKPNKIVLPKLTSSASIEDVDTGSSDDKELDQQLKDLTNVSTVAVINRMSTNTSSIVDRNDIQKKMMEDIEKVITDTVNPDTGRRYTFKDICPNFELITEIEEAEETDEDKKRKKKKADDKKKDSTEALAKDDNEYGKVFKAMGMSRSLCLSPYFFNCNDLPYPTPENLIKYSPKLEYLVKAIENVKNYHIKKNQEISGQLAYFNMIRFKYYYKKDGKAVVETFNLLELIKEYLVNKGIFKASEIAIFSSDTSDEKKEDYVKGFQDGNIKVFFGTPAMREGVDLQHKGSTLYVMTPDWNPTDMRQIEGRIWRRDNEYKYVRVIYVLLDQSIEVFIYAKLEEKARRLQQIMKERNTVAELEEMSLNPYQTKIALTTDPEKRADIITKLSEIVWIEKKNKIAQAKLSLEESKQHLDTVNTAINVAYKKYFKPFNDKFPAIDDAVITYKKKQILEDKAKNPANFVKKYFIAIDQIEDLPISDIAKHHAVRCLAPREAEYDLNFLYTITGEGVFPLLDYFRIIKLFAENYNNPEYTQYLKLFSYSEKIDFIMNKYPLWLSSNVSSHKNIASRLANNLYDKVSFYSIDSVMKMITDDERDIVIQICNKVDSLSTTSRNTIAKEILPLVNLLNDLVLEKSEDPNGILKEISISMTPKYKEINKEFKPVSEQEFESATLISKVNTLTKLQSIIDSYERNLYALPKATRENILNKTNKYPTYMDILPELRLGTKAPGELNGLDTALAPISKFRSILRDTYEEFLKPNNLDFDDIPFLTEKVQKEYEGIEDKLTQIKELKVKLVERYKAINLERKDITIDDVIKQFSLTNSYLDERLED